MLTGLSKVESYEYVSKLDKADRDEDKTYFKLGALDVNVRTMIGDNAISYRDSGETFVPHNASRAVEAVRYGLRGWRNFRDKDKRDLPFNVVTRIVAGVAYEVPDDTTIGCLPPWLLSELGDEIWRKNTFTEEMEKKLEGLS